MHTVLYAYSMHTSISMTFVYVTLLFLEVKNALLVHVVHLNSFVSRFTLLYFLENYNFFLYFSSFMDTSIETKEEQRLSSQTHSTGMVQVVAKKNKEESFPSITPTPLQRTFELNPNVIDRTSLSEQHKNMLRFLRKILVSAVSLQQ